MCAGSMLAETYSLIDADNRTRPISVSTPTITPTITPTATRYINIISSNGEITNGTFTVIAIETSVKFEKYIKDNYAWIYFKRSPENIDKCMFFLICNPAQLLTFLDNPEFYKLRDVDIARVRREYADYDKIKNKAIETLKGW